MAKNIKNLLVIPPSGPLVFTTGDLGKTLDALYQLIGCTCVERVQVAYNGKKRWMWVNENGLMDGDAYNSRASAYYPGGIVGTAVIELDKVQA